MHQRTESGIKLFAVISIACAIAAGAIEYYNTVNSVKWISFQEAFRRAGETKKMVYVDFYADWCGPCKQMDKTTFANDSVIAALKKDFFATRINVDDPTFGKQFVNQYRIEAMPTSMLLTADKREVKRAVGYLNTQEFIAWLTNED